MEHFETDYTCYFVSCCFEPIFFKLIKYSNYYNLAIQAPFYSGYGNNHLILSYSSNTDLCLYVLYIIHHEVHYSSISFQFNMELFA